MPVIISLLRGVNVGGNNKIKMADLRELYESLGLRQAETLIQSGNVVCMTSARDLMKLARRIEDAIEARFGFRCDVVLRTAGELRDALARNPFRKRQDVEPAKLAITFLAADPDPDGCAKVRAMKFVEELHIDGREVYIYFPDGMGRSKLPWPAIGKNMKTSGTARNLNTVEKLIAMADRLENAL